MTSAATVSNINSDNKEVSDASSKTTETFDWHLVFKNEDPQKLIDNKIGSLEIGNCDKKVFTGTLFQCKIAMNICDAYSSEEKAKFCREVEAMSDEERMNMRRFIFLVNGVFSGTSWSWYLEFRSQM